MRPDRLAQLERAGVLPRLDDVTRDILMRIGNVLFRHHDRRDSAWVMCDATPHRPVRETACMVGFGRGPDKDMRVPTEAEAREAGRALLTLVLGEVPE